MNTPATNVPANTANSKTPVINANPANATAGNNKTVDAPAANVTPANTFNPMKRTTQNATQNATQNTPVADSKSTTQNTTQNAPVADSKDITLDPEDNTKPQQKTNVNFSNQTTEDQDRRVLNDSMERLIKNSNTHVQFVSNIYQELEGDNYRNADAGRTMNIKRCDALFNAVEANFKDASGRPLYTKQDYHNQQFAKLVDAELSESKKATNFADRNFNVTRKIQELQRAAMGGSEDCDFKDSLFSDMVKTKFTSAMRRESDKELSEQSDAISPIMQRSQEETRSLIGDIDMLDQMENKLTLQKDKEERETKKSFKFQALNRARQIGNIFLVLPVAVFIINLVRRLFDSSVSLNPFLSEKDTLKFCNTTYKDCCDNLEKNHKAKTELFNTTSNMVNNQAGVSAAYAKNITKALNETKQILTPPATPSSKMNQSSLAAGF